MKQLSMLALLATFSFGCASVIPVGSFAAPEANRYCGMPLARSGAKIFLSDKQIDEQRLREIFNASGNSDLAYRWYDNALERTVSGISAIAGASLIGLNLKTGSVSGLGLLLFGISAPLTPFLGYVAWHNPKDGALSEYNRRMKARCGSF